MVIMTVALTVAMVFVFVITAMIASMVVVPFVLVFETAVRAFPVAVIKPTTVMAWADPAGAFIRRTAPVAFVPAIMAAHRIPVAADPNEFRRGLHGHNGDNARLGRRTDTDSH